MLNKSELLTLMKTVAKADPASPVAYSYNNESFSYDAINETLRRELKEYTKTHADYRANKNLIFELIEETMTDVLPKKVTKQYEEFAEVKTFPQGSAAKFRRPLTSNKRAKQFITRAGLGGVYEVFKLAKGEESFEVPTSAIGTAAQIGFEEFLDGRVDFAELTQIVMEGMDDHIYEEIGAALTAAVNQLPPANRVAAAGFDEDEFDRLLTIASAYGTPTIYCTYEFAVKLVPSDAWRYTETMKDELYRTGRLASYKGHKVVILEQGFVDETNTTKVIDPGYCWIIPAGANTKPVKVAFEGGAQIREVDSNADWSKEFHIYQKVGVVCMMTNDICCYTDTSLEGKMTEWFLNNKNIANTVKSI